jgi:uncharacterized protein (DUF302 family)
MIHLSRVIFCIQEKKILSGEDDMGMELGFEVNLDRPYEDSVELVVAALKAEGFGVLTRIDVRGVIKEKLGENFRPYLILGACNPNLSFRALSEDPVVGLMLPCNITVEELPTGSSLVRIVNPEMMMTVGGLQKSEIITGVAKEARTRLERVAEVLAKG